MNARRMTMLATLMGALAAALAGCAAKSDEAGEPAPAVEVRARAIETRTFVPTIEASGQWRASAELHVVAPFAAYVESLEPRIGDRVAKGQRIGWLVTRESHAAVRGSELLLRQAGDAAARDEATRALALARRELMRVPLLAASAGTVTQRAAQPGAEVAEGGDLLTLVPEGTLVFEAHVPLTQVAHVAAGQRASIAMEDGTTLAATVRTRGLPTSAADQAALVWLAPAAGGRADLVDRFGQARIEAGAGHRALAVPDSAITEDDLTGEQRVAVVSPAGIAVWTAVRLGMAQAGWHELLSPPLAAGTRVVVSGQRGLPDSTQVRLAP